MTIEKYLVPRRTKCQSVAIQYAVTSVGARFMVDFYDLVDRWAAWATEVVEAWPEDPSLAEPTLEIDR
jgi:hypothetical protein